MPPRLPENAHLSRSYRDCPHPSSLQRTQKVKGKRWKAEGENYLKSLVSVSNLKPCALSPAPLNSASFLGVSSRSKRAGWTFSISLGEIDFSTALPANQPRRPTITDAPARLLNAWRESEYLLVTSPPIIAEIKAVLDLPRIREKCALTEHDIRQLLGLLEKDTILVSGLANVGDAVPRDPSDRMFLSCAREAKADAVVSGDRHLLALEAFEGTPIMTVKRFLDLLAHQRTL